MFLHADNKNSDQTARMRSLICSCFRGQMSEGTFAHVAVPMREITLQTVLRLAKQRIAEVHK